MEDDNQVYLMSDLLEELTVILINTVVAWRLSISKRTTKRLIW
jgi:hypothetical protein